MLVSFGLNVKAINNKRIFKIALINKKVPPDRGTFTSYEF